MVDLIAADSAAGIEDDSYLAPCSTGTAPTAAYCC